MQEESVTLVRTIVEDYPFLRLAPPVAAITLALVLKEVNFALIIAIVIGCMLLYVGQTPVPLLDKDGAVSGHTEELQTTFDFMGGVSEVATQFVNQVASGEHASVILFTVLLGSMISLMNDSGGTNAVINRLARFADTRRKGQVLTWLAGLLVFFDDYANTMLIGGSVRPLTDRLKISRAKLAFLVDATAAPIAGLALSTWTAFEIDQVKVGLDAANMTANSTDVFLQTIPYRIYPLIAIIFVGVVAFTGKDFGPMLKAENAWKPNSEPSVNTNPTARGSMWTAIIPIAVLISSVIGLLYLDYRASPEDWWKNVDSYRLLLITSMASSTSAVFAAVLIGRMSLREASESWGRGIMAMIPAIIVLVLAWAINGICGSEKLDTAGYIISLIGDRVQPEFLPAIAFIAAGGMAVSIGSSFTTMGLLIPLFIPLANALLVNSGADVSTSSIFLATVGAILAGAIFGDHCSPISDTTVLSSAAAGCDHLQHVTTQVPYALVMAVCSLLFGYLPIGFGVPVWIALPISVAASIGAVMFLGRNSDHDSVTT